MFVGASFIAHLETCTLTNTRACTRIYQHSRLTPTYL
jgi:hypothetical protein